MPEKLYNYCIIRLIPNISQGEFINIGVVVVSLEENQHRVSLPKNINATKVKNWFPLLDGIFLQYIINNLASFITKCPSKNVIANLQDACSKSYWSSLQIDEPSMAVSEEDIDSILVDLVENCLDLRTKKGFSGNSSSHVRSEWRQIFKKESLLGKKVDDEPENLQPDAFCLPVLPDFRWKGVKDEFIITYSGDKGDEPGERALENALRESKSLLIDVETLLDSNLGVSVITQAPKNANGETLEYFGITEVRLKKFKDLRIIKNESEDEKKSLLRLIGEGKDLNFPISAD